MCRKANKMFSETVDLVVQRSGRPDRILDIVDFVNETMMEMQGRGFWYKNRIEDRISFNADPYIMTLPPGMQKFEAARITGTNDFFVNRVPGPRQEFAPLRYYAASGYIGFTGHTLNTDVDIAYFQYQPYLDYFAATQRPATWAQNKLTRVWEPTYNNLAPQGGTNYTLEANQPLANAMTMNWLLRDWAPIVREGALAKILKLCGDDTRAATSFSLYMKQRAENFETTEIGEGVPGSAD